MNLREIREKETSVTFLTELYLLRKQTNDNGSYKLEVLIYVIYRCYNYTRQMNNC